MRIRVSTARNNDAHEMKSNWMRFVYISSLRRKANRCARVH